MKPSCSKKAKSIICTALCFAISFIVLCGTLVSGGCQCSVSTAKVTDVKICISLNGNLCDQDNPSLSITAPTIFASCLLKHSVADTKVKFTWIYYGETKIEIDSVILNTGDTLGNMELHSSLSQPTNGWPRGIYEVIIQVQTDNADPVVKQFNIN